MENTAQGFGNKSLLWRPNKLTNTLNYATILLAESCYIRDRV